ncbi:hypothetical protein GCM10009744_65120 [Kribbella alba]|uniref:Uncharacterized protein n=1 Tax=Kribbella alba TaxID=190197 RepID=A0ABN2FYU0_9ACTN
MSSTDFVVSAYAPASSFPGQPRCTEIIGDLVLPIGWVIDSTLGDPGHPGISEAADSSNNQALTSLTSYTYAATSDRTAHVSGRICGSAWWGPGAAFERTYRVFTVAAPVPTPTAFQDYAVSVYAPAGLPWSPSCRMIAANLTTPAGWIVDRSQGDPGHFGVSELTNISNSQANSSLQSYVYAPTSDTVVRIDGRICGSQWWGPGAVFERTYRVFLVPA